MTDDQAETMALSVLGWLAAEPDLMGTFLAQSGLATDDLPTLASDRGFLAGVMDFLMAEDQRVLDVAAALGMRPEDLARAAATLVGPLPHWT